MRGPCPVVQADVTTCFLLADGSTLVYFSDVSTAEQIYEKASRLPTSAQEAVLQMVEELSQRYPTQAQAAPPLTLHESAELRGTLAAWEEDWNAPGMETYDRP